MAALRPYLLHLGGAQFDSLPIAQFVQTITREQDAVSVAELHDMPFVCGSREHSRSEPTLAQLASG